MKNNYAHWISDDDSYYTFSNEYIYRRAFRLILKNNIRIKGCGSMPFYNDFFISFSNKEQFLDAWNIFTLHGVKSDTYTSIDNKFRIGSHRIKSTKWK